MPPGFNFKVERGTNNTLVVVGRKTVSKEEIDKIVSEKLKEVGEKSKFDIRIENDTIVCTEVIEGLGEDDQVDLYPLKSNLYSIMKPKKDGSAEGQLRSKMVEKNVSGRIINILYYFSSDSRGATLEDFMNNPNHPPIRNFGKKSKIEFVEFLSNIGVDTKPYNISKWFE